MMKSQSTFGAAVLAMGSLASASTISLPFKAGLSGFPGIESLDLFNSDIVPYISWYSNYEPITPSITTSTHNVTGAPMLWGKGDQCLTGPDGPVDAWRYDNFTTYVSPSGTTADENPAVFFGFYEPDCGCNSSSNIANVQTGVQEWNKWIKPLAARGVALGSPPMCTQLDQSWLTTFAAAGVSWDVTSVHVNKPTVAEGKAVVEYYAKTFGKPVWVSELTCVNDKDWSSCGNQSAVNAFIDGMAEYLEGNDDVVAWGFNTGKFHLHLYLSSFMSEASIVS